MKYLIVVLLLLNTVILSAQDQGQIVRDVPGHSVSRFICNTDGQVLVWQAAFSNFACGTPAGGGGGCTTDDRVGIGSGSSTVCTSIPDCDDSSGNHLNYDTTTNTLTCGTSSSSSVVEGTGIDITGSTVSMDIHNALSSTTVATGDEVPVQDVSVGNAVANQRRTTAGDIALLYACTTDDQIPVGGGSTPACKSIPSCADTGGNHLNYDTSTNTLSCGTSGAASCTTDDQMAIGNGSTADCKSIPQCNEAIGEVIKYTTSSNTWSCVNILSDAGGGTPFDASRHFMFASPSGSAGIPTYEGITSGENGLGTATTSPTTIASHVSLRTCSTTSASECGWPGVGSVNAHGVLKWRFDWKAKSYYTSSGGGADDTLFNYYAGFGSMAGTSLDSVTCTAAGGTDNFEGYWFCFNKSVDSSWQACSGDGADWDCDDTGVAAPTSGDIWTMRIDSRDMANVTYYINNSLVDTRTSLLPSSSSTGAVGRTMIAKTTATTTQVRVGMGFIEMTWD